MRRITSTTAMHFLPLVLLAFWGCEPGKGGAPPKEGEPAVNEAAVKGAAASQAPGTEAAIREGAAKGALTQKAPATKLTTEKANAKEAAAKETDLGAGAPNVAPAALARDAAEASLTDEMRRELGAAAWIPQDASYFSASFRLGEQWKAFSESGAFKKLMTLPVVQMGLQQITQNPFYIQLLERRKSDPLLASALEVASDAWSREIFIYADAGLTRVFSAACDIYLQFFLEGLRSAASQDSRSGPPAPPSLAPAIISSVLQHEKDLRFPPVILGFRLSRPDAARSFLADIAKTFRDQLPVPLQEESVAGGSFHTIKLDAKMIPPGEREDLSNGLRSEGVAAEAIEKFNAFLDSQTLAISVGVRGDYLLFSIGPDLEHLAKLGQGKSLAEAKALAPVRRIWKPRAASLLYVDANLLGTGKAPVDNWMLALDKLIESLPAKDLPEGLIPRVKKDVRALLEDVNRYLPDSAPLVSAGFLNQGLEGYSFSAVDPTLDAGKPLSILSRAGTSPLVAVAGRSARMADAYVKFARWVKVAYGYFEDYGVPRIPEGDRADFERFRKVFLPAIKELHETTESLLVPAIDGCQDLIVLDGGGKLPSFPGSAEPLPAPLRYPRPALIVEVNDAEKLQQAFSRYRETVNKFLKQAGPELEFSPFEIPAPASRQHAGGTLYTYPLPFSLGPDFEPHALVSGKYAVLSLAPSHSKDMVESSATMPEGVVKLSAAAAVAYRVDLRGLSGLVFEDLGIFLSQLQKQGALPEEAAKLIGLHLPVLKEVLGALKSCSGRVYVEDGLQVHHSWLEVEDLIDG
jgi:hypothetical protein